MWSNSSLLFITAENTKPVFCGDVMHFFRCFSRLCTMEILLTRQEKGTDSEEGVSTDMPVKTSSKGAITHHINDVFTTPCQNLSPALWIPNIWDVFAVHCYSSLFFYFSLKLKFHQSTFLLHCEELWGFVGFKKNSN